MGFFVSPLAKYSRARLENVRTSEKGSGWPTEQLVPHTAYDGGGVYMALDVVLGCNTMTSSPVARSDVCLPGQSVTTTQRMHT